MIPARLMMRFLTGTVGFVLMITLGLATNAQTGQMQPTPQPAPQAVPQAAPQANPQTAPAAAPSQAPSVCANQPFCYEAPDFVAVVTDFRTSAQGYWKIIDVTLRFLNKTPNPLVLGYTNGSGIALDDRGNRYGVGGANGVRGMGLVNGGNFDPRFSVQPRGFGDARFELVMTNNPQIIYGFTFELDMSVNEISTLEGNQHSLGSEFPLQFQGLANGSKGSVPGIPAGGSGFFGGGANPMTNASASLACGPAGTLNSVAGATNSAAAQNAANTVTNTASNAASAISNLKSIFGKKNAAQPAATTAAAPAPCVPAPSNPAAVGSAAPPPVGVAPTGSAAVNTQAPTTNSPAANAVGVKAPVAPAAAAPKPAAQPAPTTAKKPAPATTQKKPAPTTDPNKPPQK